MRILALLLALAASAQQPESGFKISVTSNLVIVNVGVRDKDDKPIENLKPEDFQILEDGKPQKISVFEFQSLETEVAPVVAVPPPPGSATPPKREITPSKPGQIRYKDRRLMVMYFDFSGMPQQDQLRAQSAALKFIDEQMTPSDLVSIMSFTNKLQVMQDFTQDHERLRTVISSFRIGDASELAATAATGAEEEGEDTGAAFEADETEFNIFNTDRKLGALESAAKMLASLPEKKVLVYFSSGVGKTGAENNSQLRSTINAAVRGNVAFYPVDSQGLMASAPAGDASRGAPKGASIFSGKAQMGQRDKQRDQQETLFTLAADTGGKALLDNNDLTSGIRQAQAGISSYYILGYYTSNPAEDGRYRRVKVSIASQPRARLDFRSGYFAPKQFRDYNSTDRERHLEEALALGDPITDLPLALEVNYFRMKGDRYFVPVAIKLPGSQIDLARAGKSDEAQLDFIGQVRDAHGRIAGTVRDNIKVKLKGENAARLRTRQLEYDTGFTLPPGEFTIKFLARENESGKIGTFETKFVVPDLTATSPWLPISSIVWGNQREALSAAIGAAEKDKKAIAMHPLIQGGQKLIPSITRVYRTDQFLYVYFEVYDAAVTAERKEPSITASLSFFQGKTKAFESKPVRVSQASAARRHATPVQIQVPLKDLKAGRYICQLNVIDELGKKFNFGRAPMVLLAHAPAAASR
ncbi:MAG: VWA domain-containing protein [Acidobacteriia bacterium]|nr:VWA domain-containing protein [Terriglobia bacterium]